MTVWLSLPQRIILMLSSLQMLVSRTMWPHQYKPVVKTLHHAVNVNSTEAKLFTIRYGINQATNSISIHKIIVVTDSIYATKKIFKSLSHPFQIHLAAILQELHKFFLTHQENSIKFWECPSHCNWLLHKVVDNESKLFNSAPLCLYKSLWDYSKKESVIISPIIGK